MNKLMVFIKDETGASLIEYSLLLAMIAAACIVVMQGLATNISTGFNNMGSSVSR